jgi:alpha-L-fucosidase
MMYFDDTVLPLYPVSDAGLRVAAYLYNDSIRRHSGKLEAVVTGKILSEVQKKCMVWDIERGMSNQIEPLAWQTDTCIGSWHYDSDMLRDHRYKSVDQVVHMLVDIVSKNGNLMLNIPLPGSGIPDDDELKFIAGLTSWMQMNSEGIYASRPWRVFGEGPAMAGAAMQGQGFNESNKAYTAQDFRFMRKGDDLYAYAMNWPETGTLAVRSLGTGTPTGSGKVERVTLLGAGSVPFTRDETALTVTLPAQKPGDHVYGLKIEGNGLTA